MEVNSARSALLRYSMTVGSPRIDALPPECQ
jgi:hypothetical protein